jgi:hypothetical protein
MLESNQKLMMQLMQQMMANNSNGRPKDNTSNTGIVGDASKVRYEDWQLEKKGDSIQMNGKTWWWCPHHNEEKGLYVRHKPASHAAWKQSKEKGKHFREQE